MTTMKASTPDKARGRKHSLRSPAQNTTPGRWGCGQEIFAPVGAAS